METESTWNESLAFGHLMAAATLCPFLADGWEDLFEEQKHVITDWSPDLLSRKRSVDRTSVMNEINMVWIS